MLSFSLTPMHMVLRLGYEMQVNIKNYKET